MAVLHFAYNFDMVVGGGEYCLPTVPFWFSLLFTWNLILPEHHLEQVSCVTWVPLFTGAAHRARNYCSPERWSFKHELVSLLRPKPAGASCLVRSSGKRRQG